MYVYMLSAQVALSGARFTGDYAHVGRFAHFSYTCIICSFLFAIMYFSILPYFCIYFILLEDFLSL